MQKKYKYNILTAALAGELEDKVNLRIEEGWDIKGGVSVSIAVDYYGKVTKLYAQSIVKSLVFLAE